MFRLIVVLVFFFFLMIRRPPRSTLFPYTTLSDLGQVVVANAATQILLRQAPQASGAIASRSEEHTSELQSLTNLVCRLLLEKKKKNKKTQKKNKKKKKNKI